MLISEITVEFQALKDKILVKIYPKLHCEFQKAFNYSIITMDFWEYTEYNLRLIWVELLMSMKIMKKKRNSLWVLIQGSLFLSLSHAQLIWCLNPLGHRWSGYEMHGKYWFYFTMTIFSENLGWLENFILQFVWEKLKY